MAQPGQPPAVDNNMTMSIVSIFLFWPLAIPAIIIGIVWYVVVLGCCLLGGLGSLFSAGAASSLN
jgi:ABC-type sugar transport system permease subunit